MIVSACLLGVACRYDGRNCADSAVLEEIAGKRFLVVCPEQLGGLTTPREPAFLTGGDGFDVLDGQARVITRSGRDVTEQFLRGADEVLKIAALSGGAKRLLLKEKSPSCGVTQTTIDDRKRAGCGVTAALMSRAGYRLEGWGAR